MTEGGEDRGRLRGEHRRAVERALRRHDGDGEIGDVEGAAGDREQPLLRQLVEEPLLSAGDRHDDRSPQVVALGRLRDLAFVARENVVVVDLFERQRRLTLAGPDARGPAEATAFGRVEREQPQERMNGFRRDVADEGEAHQIAVVEQRGRFRDAGLRRIGRRAFHHQRVRRDADRERGAERRLANRLAETGDGEAQRRMVRRVERPVSRGHDEGPSQLKQTARQFRRQLGSL